MRQLLKTTKLALLFFLLNCTLYAQESIMITGSVVDEQGEKLSGVNIVEKGTNNGVVSDFDGRFSIKVSHASQLNFSFVGMKPQLRDVDGKKNMMIMMVEKEVENKDITIIDYQKKSTTKKSSTSTFRGIGKTLKEDKERILYKEILSDKVLHVANKNTMGSVAMLSAHNS